MGGITGPGCARSAPGASASLPALQPTPSVVLSVELLLEGLHLIGLYKPEAGLYFIQSLTNCRKKQCKCSQKDHTSVNSMLCNTPISNEIELANWVSKGHTSILHLRKRPPSRFIKQSLHVPAQILRFMPTLTILPLTPIIHTPDLIIQPNRTTNPHAHVLTMPDTLSEQPHPVRARVPAHAVVQHAKVESVF